MERQVIHAFSADGEVREITAGPGGNLWFTEDDGNKIGRIASGK